MIFNAKNIFALLYYVRILRDSGEVSDIVALTNDPLPLSIILRKHDGTS